MFSTDSASGSVFGAVATRKKVVLSRSLWSTWDLGHAGLTAVIFVLSWKEGWGAWGAQRQVASLSLGSGRRSSMCKDRTGRENMGPEREL